MTVQQPNSIITFYAGVPHQDTMKDTLMFTSRAEQEAWHATYQMTQFDMTIDSGRQSYLQRVDRVIKVPYKYEDILQCNYVRIENPSYVGGQHNTVWWGFIDLCSYSSDGMVLVNWSVDPIQTFMFDYEVLNSFIVKGHINEYDPNNISYNLGYPMPSQDFINSSAWLSDDGIGGAGLSELFTQKPVIFGNPHSAGLYSADINDEVAWLVMGITWSPTTKINISRGTNAGLPTQVNYFVAPFSTLTGMLLKLNITGANPESGSGANFWVNENADGKLLLNNLLSNIQTDPNWTTQGSITSSYVTRSIGMPFTYTQPSGPLNPPNLPGTVNIDMNQFLGNEYAGNVYAGIITDENGDNPLQMMGIWNVPQFAPEFGTALVNLTPYEMMYNAYLYTDMTTKAATYLYNEFHAYPPLKIFRAPFFNLRLENGKGISYDIDMRAFQYQGYENALQMYRTGSVGVTNVMEYFLDFYKVNNDLDRSTSLIAQQTALGLIENQDTSIEVFNSPQEAYMNANRNQIAVNKQNAGIQYANTVMQNNTQLQNLATGQASQQRIQTANNAAGISNMLSSFNYDYSADTLQYGKNTVAGAVAGMANGSIMGAVGGAAKGIGGGTAAVANDYLHHQMQAQQTNTALGLAQQTLGLGQGSDTQQLKNSVDTNNKVAKSQKDMTINAINAGIQDMGNQPPNGSGHGSSINNDWGNNNQSLYIQTWRGKEQGTISAMINYQLFGYSISNYANVTSFIQENQRQKFNYIQTAGAFVWSSTMNGKWRNTIMALYDSGFTFWWDPVAYTTRDITGNIQNGLTF